MPQPICEPAPQPELCCRFAPAGLPHTVAEGAVRHELRSWNNRAPLSEGMRLQ